MIAGVRQAKYTRLPGYFGKRRPQAATPLIGLAVERES
jgi:hypothetical protein